MPPPATPSSSPSATARTATSAATPPAAAPPSPPPAVPAASVTSAGRPSGLAGTSVTISGANFHSGAAVTFGGVAATGVTVVDPNTIVCTTPAHTPRAVDVVVPHPDSAAATLTSGFTYTAPTVDLAVTPTATPPSVAVGNAVTFTTTVKNNGTGGATGVSLTQTV